MAEEQAFSPTAPENTQPPFPRSKGRFVALAATGVVSVAAVGGVTLRRYDAEAVLLVGGLVLIAVVGGIAVVAVPYAISVAVKWLGSLEAGLIHREPSPFEKAIDGWILGSDQFADRMRELIRPTNRRPKPATRQPIKTPLGQAEIIRAVCEAFEISPDQLSKLTKRPLRPWKIRPSVRA